jgi:hypothetical protein
MGKGVNGSGGTRSDQIGSFAASQQVLIWDLRACFKAADADHSNADHSPAVHRPIPSGALRTAPLWTWAATCAAFSSASNCSNPLALNASWGLSFWTAGLSGPRPTPCRSIPLQLWAYHQVFLYRAEVVSIQCGVLL